MKISQITEIAKHVKAKHKKPKVNKPNLGHQSPHPMQGKMVGETESPGPYFGIKNFEGWMAEKYPALPIKILTDPKYANIVCLLYTSPSPRDRSISRMPSSA